LVEEAKNLYKLEIEVVAVTPFMVVVSTEPFSSNEEVLELIIDEVDISPFTMEVRIFTAEFNWFWFMNFALVVDIIPFTFDSISKELVEVEIVKELLFIIVEVDTDPPMLDVKVLILEVREFGTMIEATFKLEILASPMLVVELLVVEAFKVAKLAESPKITVKYADKPEIIPDTKFSINELVVVELVIVAEVASKETRLALLASKLLKTGLLEKV
jgi:hypothetical protein